MTRPRGGQKPAVGIYPHIWYTHLDMSRSTGPSSWTHHVAPSTLRSISEVLKVVEAIAEETWDRVSGRLRSLEPVLAHFQVRLESVANIC
jgi:hypothetical protein